VLDLFDKRHRHRRHQCRRGELVAPVEPEESHDASIVLDLRDVDVQVHPVDRLDFQRDVFLENFGCRAC
jgi:hypothetical protein